MARSETRFDETVKSTDMSIPNSRQQEYGFVTESYEGSGGYKNGSNLFKFAREDNFEQRRKQVYYRNYIKGVANSLITPVFSTPAIREIDPDNDLVDGFLLDVDNKKTKIQDFTKKVVHYSRLHGVCFVVVDNFPESEIDKNQAINIENRVFPYSYIKTGAAVYDFTVNDFGSLETISFFEKWRVGIDGTKECVYKMWTNMYSQLFVIKKGTDTFGNVLTEKNNKDFIGEKLYHNLGQLPIVSVYSVESEDILPASPYYDLCRINLAIYNQDSEQRVSERNSAFSMLVMPGLESQSNMDVGTTSVLWVDPETSITPSFISPPADVLKLLGERADNNIKSLLEQANTLGATAVETGATAKSGVALGYEFLGQNYSLKETAGIADNFEVEMLNVFKLYTKESFTYRAKYSDNYAPTLADLTRKLDILERVLDRADLPEAILMQVKLDYVDLLAAIQKYKDEDIAKMKDSIVAEESLI